MVNVKVPTEADEEAETVNVELKLGAPDAGLKLPVIPGGRPDTVRETD